MVKQSPRLPASNVSANPGLTLELQTSGGPDSSKEKKKKKGGKKPKNKQEHRNAAPDKSPDLCYDKRSHFETKLLRGLQNTGQKKTFPFTRGQMIHRGVYVTNKPSREARWPVKPSTATRAEHRKRLVS